jgi:thymidine kinase
MSLQKQMGGEIQMILGPMFAGKTTELLRRVRRYKIAGKSVVVISKLDKVETHDKQNIEFRQVKEYNTNSYTLLCKYDVIGIDEGQFYNEIEDMADMLANIGKIVIISALDATYQRKPFMNILNVIPKAENVTKLTSVCHECGSDGSFSKRINKDNNDLIVLGAEDKYRSVCRSCYNK